MKFTLPMALVLCSSAWAQDQQVGARTKAMGGSYTAFEDDPVSVWLNPAGIATQTDAASVSYQTFPIYDFEIGGNDIEGGSAEPSWTDPAIVPSYLGATYQLGTPESPQAVGFCFTSPFRMKMTWLSVQGGGTIPAVDDQSFYRFRIAYARDFRFSQEGFLTHLALGVGLDVNVTTWNHTEFKPIPGGGSATLNVSGSDMGFGGGAGVLLGVYDNTRNFKVNLGAAYQSKANYDFSLNFSGVPLFDWPDQFQAGMTFYLLEGLPLRLTIDAQLIQWSRACRESDIAGVDDFQDVLNYSLGLEWRIKVAPTTNLYPRAGVRLFDAPWDDADKLPAIGISILDIDSRDDRFLIASFGFGIGWSNDAGKLRAFDIAVDVGGDAPGMAVGFTLEF